MTTKKKLIDTLKPLVIPVAGILVAGVVAFAAYSVDQAMHMRDFNDLVEEVAELEQSFETELKELVESLEKAIDALIEENRFNFGDIIDLQNANRDRQTDILLMQRDIAEALRGFTARSID